MNDRDNNPTSNSSIVPTTEPSPHRDKRSTIYDTVYGVKNSPTFPRGPPTPIVPNIPNTQGSISLRMPNIANVTNPINPRPATRPLTSPVSLQRATSQTSDITIPDNISNRIRDTLPSTKNRSLLNTSSVIRLPSSPRLPPKTMGPTIVSETPDISSINAAINTEISASMASPVTIVDPLIKREDIVPISDRPLSPRDDTEITLHGQPLDRNTITPIAMAESDSDDDDIIIDKRLLDLINLPQNTVPNYFPSSIETDTAEFTDPLDELESDYRLPPSIPSSLRTQPTQSTQSMQLTQPMQSTQPNQPIQSTQSTQPIQSTQSIQSIQSTPSEMIIQAASPIAQVTIPVANISSSLTPIILGPNNNSIINSAPPTTTLHQSTLHQSTQQLLPLQPIQPPIASRPPSGRGRQSVPTLTQPTLTQPTPIQSTRASTQASTQSTIQSGRQPTIAQPPRQSTQSTQSTQPTQPPRQTTQTARQTTQPPRQSSQTTSGPRQSTRTDSTQRHPTTQSPITVPPMITQPTITTSSTSHPTMLSTQELIPTMRAPDQSNSTQIISNQAPQPISQQGQIPQPVAQSVPQHTHQQIPQSVQVSQHTHQQIPQQVPQSVQIPQSVQVPQSVQIPQSVQVSQQISQQVPQSVQIPQPISINSSVSGVRQPVPIAPTGTRQQPTSATMHQASTPGFVTTTDATSRGNMMVPKNLDNVPVPSVLTSNLPPPNIPSYSLMPLEEQAQHLANFRTRFGILRNSWPSYHIPDIPDGMPLEQIHAQYDIYVRHIHINRDVDQYKVYLVISWLLIELFCTKIGLNVGGYTVAQMRSMSKYERLLIELGETNHRAAAIGGVAQSPWPVEIQICFMALVNVIAFILVKLLISYTGITEGMATTIIDGLTSFLSGTPPQPGQVLFGGPHYPNGQSDMSSSAPVGGTPLPQLGGAFGGIDVASLLGNLGSMFIRGQAPLSSQAPANIAPVPTAQTPNTPRFRPAYAE
jgi:hypothetical protein